MFINNASWPKEGEAFQSFSNHIPDCLLSLQSNDNITTFMLYESWSK